MDKLAQYGRRLSPYMPPNALQSALQDYAPHLAALAAAGGAGYLGHGAYEKYRDRPWHENIARSVGLTGPGQTERHYTMLEDLAKKLYARGKGKVQEVGQQASKKYEEVVGKAKEKVRPPEKN